MGLLKEHRGFLLILAVSALLFASDIREFKEFVRAESYFALGARLMVEQGEWLTPHAPDEQILNKPPLTYWLIGISYILFGAGYGVARLPSVLAALAVLGIVYAMGFRLAGKRAGLISAAVLATSILFMSFARTAMSDMPLTLFVTAGMASLIVVLTSNRKRVALALIGFTGLALGVLTKGPIALTLVAIPIAIDLILSRSAAGLKRIPIVTGVLTLLLVAAPYFVLVYVRLGAAPLRLFLLTENLQRFTGQVYPASARPFWYEFVAFFSAFAPWSLLIPVSIVVDLFARRREMDRAKRILYLWLGSTIALFSLSSFKLDYYLLPAMPAAALIVGLMIASAKKPISTTRVAQVFIIVCCVLVILAALLSARAAGQLQAGALLRFLPLVPALGGAGVVGVHAMRRNIWGASMSLSGVIAATFLSAQLVLLPLFVPYLPVTQLVSSAPKDRVWFTSSAAGDWANDLAFNLPNPHRVERLTEDKDNHKLLEIMKNDQRVIALVRERDLDLLAPGDPTIKVLARVETYGHGGLSLNMLRQPKREGLLVVGH